MKLPAALGGQLMGFWKYARLFDIWRNIPKLSNIPFSLTHPFKRLEEEELEEARVPGQQTSSKLWP